MLFLNEPLAVGKSLAVSPDGKTLYVTRANEPCKKSDGKLGSPFSVVNLQSRSIERTLCLQLNVELVALSHDGAYLFVSNGTNLSAFDARRVGAAGNGALLNDIPVE